jgi:hypothetical protein
VVGGGYYASPFWFGYGWAPYAPWGYPYPYPYPYAYDPSASVRLEVTPKEAEVYVDGYYAGIVDDFDGTFQRLHVPPGSHQLTLYRDGMRTVHQTMYLSVGSTFKVKYKMEPLAPGDVAEPRPTPPPPPPNQGAPDQQGPPPEGQFGPPPGAPAPTGPPPSGPPPGARGRGTPPPPPTQGIQVSNTNYGTLAIRVQPGNATVTIDGERWQGPQGEERLLVQVAEGTHRIQIQKDGFETFSTDVTMRRGETTPLNVSLHTR